MVTNKQADAKINFLSFTFCSRLTLFCLFLGFFLFFFPWYHHQFYIFSYKFVLVIFFVLFLLLLPHYSLLSLPLLRLNHLPILLCYSLHLFLFLFTSCASHSTCLLFFSSIFLYSLLCLAPPPFSFHLSPWFFLLHLALPWLADCLFRAPFITERHFYNHSLSWALYHGIIFLPNPHFSLLFHPSLYWTLRPPCLHFILPSFALSLLPKMNL